jgi:hypothetical protein
VIPRGWDAAGRRNRGNAPAIHVTKYFLFPAHSGSKKP